MTAAHVAKNEVAINVANPATLEGEDSRAVTAISSLKTRRQHQGREVGSARARSPLRHEGAVLSPSPAKVESGSTSPYGHRPPVHQTWELFQPLPNESGNLAGSMLYWSRQHKCRIDNHVAFRGGRDRPV